MQSELKKLHIDGLDYEVVIVDKFNKAGLLNYQEQTITLCKTTPTYMMQVLFHEFIHLIDENRLGNKLSESDINAIGCGIYQILADNPDLFKEGEKWLS